MVVLSLTQIGRGGGRIRGLFYELFSLFSSFEVVFAASETDLSRMFSFFDVESSINTFF